METSQINWEALVNLNNTLQHGRASEVLKLSRIEVVNTSLNMPSYELALIIKALQRPELAQTIRRTCENIISRGGIIQKMENLGLKTLPYKMVSHGAKNVEGNYILIKFDGRTNSILAIEDELKRDVDIVKPNIFREEAQFERPCDKGPCVFGELPNPDHELRVWKRKALKKMKYTKSEKDLLK